MPPAARLHAPRTPIIAPATNPLLPNWRFLRSDHPVRKQWWDDFMRGWEQWRSRSSPGQVPTGIDRFGP